MARRMMSKGLLERERSTLDARANAVRLTEAGREALAEARPKMTAADNRLLKLIAGGGRRTAFVALLGDPFVGEDQRRPGNPKAPKPGRPRAAKAVA